MMTYKVDLDYESFLFDTNYIEDSPSSLKIIREFEYVFFFINQSACALKNYRNYEKNYLTKIKNLGFIVPDLNPHAKNAMNWWGNRHNYTLEQTLNSKITSAEIARRNNWGFFQGAIVRNTDELEAHLKNFPLTTYLLRCQMTQILRALQHPPLRPFFCVAIREDSFLCQR